MSTQYIRGIEARDKSIISEFSCIQDCPSLVIHHLMNIGNEITIFSPEEKMQATLIPGCLAKVWLIASYRSPQVVFRADSAANITRGLVTLLVRLFSGATPRSIMNYDPQFPQVLKLEEILGTQRRNGFSSMVNTFQLEAQRFIMRL
ncbi:MAG: SufE family protein [Bacteroidota bacterium]